MESDIFSCFFTAAGDIFAENNIKYDKISIPGPVQKTLQVVSAIGITGDLRGNLIFGCAFPDAHAIVSSLFQSSDILVEENVFSELQKATIGEFANQIAGRALMNLSRASLDCNMTPPTVLSGDSVKPDLCQTDQEFVSQIEGEFGSAVLRVGIKTCKKVDKK